MISSEGWKTLNANRPRGSGDVKVRMSPLITTTAGDPFWSSALARGG
jgi:hypothetical protein